jgi:hypothetical protein
LLSDSAKGAKFNMSFSPLSTEPVFFVAALDWGLGHATRCIPIIEKLKARGAQVILGGTGASGKLLEGRFPELVYHELPGHEVRYAKSKSGLALKIMQQLPALFKIVESEHRWLNDFLKGQKIHAVISDNRYGLYNTSVITAILTHQLDIRTPFGSIGNALLRRKHYRLIEKFNTCWVPDSQAGGLSGSLAHPDLLPSLTTHYIGPVSRFKKATSSLSYDLVIMLSGPEPQRSIWEEELCRQLTAFKGSALLLRGRPGDVTTLNLPEHIRVASHLPDAELEAALNGAGMILARSGYSSIMDIHAVQKKSILVPTPGQTEQEYLARYLRQAGFALCLPQKKFNITEALEQAKDFNYKLPAPSIDKNLDEAIDELYARIGMHT